jgi:hypothetical protein
MRPGVGITLLVLLGSPAQADDENPYVCTKHTLHECLLALPCEKFQSEPGGDIVVSSAVKIRLADTLEGDFNQRDFNRDAEKKCGKVQ